MAIRQNIDEALCDWPFSPGVIHARLIYADDGRELLQMRIELGLLQMEVGGRPDGQRPGGADTYLDFLVQQTVSAGETPALSDGQIIEVDREFLQYYHRRLCWLALRQFRRAVADADHTLALMDFVADHSPSDAWTVSHERYRPLVLFHRTQAAALAGLEESGPEAAMTEIDRGLARLCSALELQDAEDQTDQQVMTNQLAELRQWLRESYHLERTLDERLGDAVAAEQFELAAQLRDEIARRRAKTV
jgi:hypothetical protein